MQEPHFWSTSDKEIYDTKDWHHGYQRIYEGICFSGICSGINSGINSGLGEGKEEYCPPVLHCATGLRYHYRRIYQDENKVLLREVSAVRILLNHSVDGKDFFAGESLHAITHRSGEIQIQHSDGLVWLDDDDRGTRWILDTRKYAPNSNRDY